MSNIQKNHKNKFNHKKEKHSFEYLKLRKMGKKME